jgi:hypothetical protein
MKLLSESELKTNLSVATRSESFQYVNSFVNTIKHRDLVDLNAQLDFAENRAGIRFCGFKYDKKCYPQLWAEDTLQHSLNVKNDIIHLGKILERLLGM